MPSTSIGGCNKLWPNLLVNEQDCDLICHVYDYFRVASAVAVPPGESQAAADRIDLAASTKDWTFPIAVVAGHNERTRGCVVVDGDVVTASLDLGIDIKCLRRLTGARLRGSFAIFPVQHLVDLGRNLGADCVERDDGRVNRTCMLDEAMKTVRRVDLPPRGKKVPGLPAFASTKKVRGRRKR